jgi:hypothetical protein
MTSLKAGLNIVAALFGLAAAFLWLRSTVAKVPLREVPDESGMIPASISEDGIDVLATAARQTWWSKWAACAASISAIAQSVALLVPEMPAR